MLQKSKQEIEAIPEAQRILYLAAEAVRLNASFVERMIHSGLTDGRDTLCIFVASGHVYSTAITPHDVLAGMVVGNPHKEEWKHPFEEIAESKMTISCRTGKPTVDVPLEEREPGDTQYYGSEVVDGLVVACSGFQAELDEMVSGMIAMTLRGLMKLHGIKWGPFSEPPETVYKDDFIPEPSSA